MENSSSTCPNTWVLAFQSDTTSLIQPMAGMVSWTGLQVTLALKRVVLYFSVLSTLYRYYGRTVAFIPVSSLSDSGCQFSKCEANLSWCTVHSLYRLFSVKSLLFSASELMQKLSQPTIIPKWHLWNSANTKKKMMKSHTKVRILPIIISKYVY